MTKIAGRKVTKKTRRTTPAPSTAAGNMVPLGLILTEEQFEALNRGEYPGGHLLPQEEALIRMILGSANPKS